jgi:hypothetical protein
MSRQGLYLVFPRKEEVFAASVTILDDMLHEQLEAGFRTRRGLGPKLDFFFDQWIEGVFEPQQTEPDLRDMDDLSFPIVGQVYARKIALIQTLIREEAGGGIGADRSALLARATMFAVRGFFATAADPADMRRLARLQVALLVGHVGAETARG